MSNFANEDEQNCIDNLIYVISEGASAQLEVMDDFFKISESNNPKLYLNVFLECFFFYLHLVMRITFSIFGDNGRKALQKKLYGDMMEKLSIIYQQYISYTNLSEIREVLLPILNERELNYGGSNTFFDKDKPFTGDAILTKFAQYICFATNEAAPNPASLAFVQTSFAPKNLEVLENYIRKEVVKIL